MTTDQAKSGVEKTCEGRVARLSIWNRLFHGIPVSSAELDSESLLGDPDWAEDRGSYVFLRACVAVSNSARQAIRYALRPATLYWVSNASEHRDDSRVLLRPTRTVFHLREAVGTRMTWDEAVAAVGRKPVDYAGYMCVLKIVEEEYLKEWTRLFPAMEPASIAPLSSQDRQTQFARRWET